VARKILFYETGGPEVLKIVEVLTPEPGAGEIRIRVKAIGLNRSEVNFRAGTCGPPPALPAQLGSEVSGEVDAVGTGVTNFKTGDAVSVIATFGPAQYGLYGDLVLAPARSVVKHPCQPDMGRGGRELDAVHDGLDRSDRYCEVGREGYRPDYGCVERRRSRGDSGWHDREVPFPH
jgi:threonine dehydrogenase-like Zn-dependent dehydrogenase